MKYLDTFKERHPKAAHHISRKLVTAARYLLAALFILSGASKAIDPFGLSIKLGEYFSAFGLDFLRIFDDIGAILLPSAELLIGFMLLSGISRRAAAWYAFVGMTFFTLLTLWLAIANPVSDCGCFGDLVHLTNWETFFKNLIFYPFAIIVFLARNSQRQLNPSPLRTAVTYAILAPLSLGLSIYCYSYLPPIDPTPFKTGVNILHAMTVHENDTQTVLVYRNRQDGTLQDFAIEDTTWYDSSRWEYVDTKTTGRSTAPEIKAVPMFEGNIDRSDEILERKGYTLLFVINDYDPRYEPDMFMLADYIHRYGGRAVALSAASLPASLAENGIEPLSSDYTVLRTMIQHRTGGALLLHDGTILDKWPMNRLPHWEETAHDPLSNVLTDNRIDREKLLSLLFALGIAVIAVSTVRPPVR
ncbi:BT_3928 family protein [uncultured Rikenella sp.]|uniref:BT_3928 family protein n=1 Tax=uncultured Rikenella sp. TaxID=368003 RepID=UPI00262F4D6A|nr:BT_3928 family protein [uncultured Rikenella sp.]